MPGVRGQGRVPSLDDARTRRNWNASATAYASRSLGSGIGLDSNNRITLQLQTGSGLLLDASGLSIVLDPDADNKLSLSAAGLAANITGGDGINFPGQEISVNLIDNTIMAKVGAAAAGPLSMPLNTVLVRAGDDIVALSMPHVFDESGSLLVRDGFTPDLNLKALVTPKNTVPVVDTAGNWVARTFTPNANIVADSQGGLSATVLGNSRWVITDSAGVLTDLLAITDWMLVGVANAPTFLISANNALVGKFGSAATAFNIVNANEIVLRAGGDLDGFLVGAQQIIGRKAADIVAHTLTDFTLLGKAGTGDWGNIAVPGTNRLVGRGTGDISSFSMNLNSVFGRAGGVMGAISIPAQGILLHAGVDLTTLAFSPNSFLVRLGGDLTQQIVGNHSLMLRGSGDLADIFIADGELVGRPIGGNLGPVTRTEAREIVGTDVLSAKTANYTIVSTDSVIICDATAGSFTITLPAASSVTGRKYHIIKIDSTGNTVTLDGDGVETINDATTQVLTVQYESITVVSDAAEWWVIQ